MQGIPGMGQAAGIGHRVKDSQFVPVHFIAFLAPDAPGNSTYYMAALQCLHMTVPDAKQMKAAKK
ncbi:hypothetical protein GCM10011341_32360 [Frigidibacter albus]|nr:hypothetical protein GCM10011341_32360 [Frigidibacter albus]